MIYVAQVADLRGKDVFNDGNSFLLVHLQNPAPFTKSDTFLSYDEADQRCRFTLVERLRSTGMDVIRRVYKNVGYLSVSTIQLTNNG